ncbi:MAG: efflux RND transporter periplasmic adaptor subunit [Terriglobia bacterium]
MPRKKKAYLTGAALFLALLVIFLLWRDSPAQASTVRVEPKEFAITLRAEGELRAVRSVSITAPRIGGRLQIIKLVKAGTAVQPGDVLLVFDPADKLKASQDAGFDIRSAEEEVTKMKAQLEAELAQLRIELKKAETEAASARIDLGKREVLARIEAEKAELKAQEAEYALAHLRERMEAKKRQAAAELEILEVKRRKAEGAKAAAEQDVQAMTITAPISGLVVYKQIWKGGERADPQEGDTVWPGLQLMEIPDLAELEVHAFVHESDGGQLAVEQRAKVRMDAFPDQEFDARVARLSSLAQRRSWNNPVKYFTAILTLEASNERMRPGMTTSVDIIVETVSEALSVPLEAVFERESEPAVYVKNGRSFELRRVKLGKRNATHVVVEGGLEAGDEVALRDPTVPPSEGAPGARAAPSPG